MTYVWAMQDEGNRHGAERAAWLDVHTCICADNKGTDLVRCSVIASSLHAQCSLQDKEETWASIQKREACLRSVRWVC